MIFNGVLYRLHTGCQSAVDHHSCKRSRNSSLERLLQQSIQVVQDAVDLSVLNPNGRHPVTKRVAMQM